MTPDRIDTLILNGAALIWLFAVLGACVYVVRLLSEHETRRRPGYQPRPAAGPIGQPPSGGSVVKSRTGTTSLNVALADLSPEDRQKVEPGVLAMVREMKKGGQS